MLTPRQQQTLQFIRQFIRQHDYAPTISEITAELGVHSRAMVQRILQALEKNHYIKRISGIRRNIALLQSSISNSLPLVGRIAAGFPIEAIPQQRDIDIAQLVLGDNRYLLEVKGDSMGGDSICDGDWIICERCETAPTGKIVVALLDQQEATLKRIYYRPDGYIVLEPSNTSYESQVYAADRIEIQGIYIGLLRMV